jgi:hypothetical protein
MDLHVCHRPRDDGQEVLGPQDHPALTDIPHHSLASSVRSVSAFSSARKVSSCIIRRVGVNLGLHRATFIVLIDALRDAVAGVAAHQVETREGYIGKQSRARPHSCPLRLTEMKL